MVMTTAYYSQFHMNAVGGLAAPNNYPRMSGVAYVGYVACVRACMALHRITIAWRGCSHEL